MPPPAASGAPARACRCCTRGTVAPQKACRPTYAFPPAVPSNRANHAKRIAATCLSLAVGTRHRSPNRNSEVGGRTAAFSRRISPELCLVIPPSCPRGRREGRVLTSHPRSAARKAHAGKPHSSIQVVPITRPSLRDGRTAYAVLSREPSSLWPPSPSRKSPASRRLTQMPHPPGLDRSNDGQDHTVLPYARPALSPQFFQPCRRSRKLTDETNLTAPLVGTKPWAHGEQSALPLASRTRTLPRPPQARLANVTTTRSPLKDEPGWATHTPFPNFGKGEYF
ncbi:hypothetical protein Bra471DRAFT_03218 [Bradyrhizobium sp. WSM471]|nr:hypothetical protein Bra471DRAFT_03218 [Bradyrhizobium sp. WSM471]